MDIKLINRKLIIKIVIQRNKATEVKCKTLYKAIITIFKRRSVIIRQHYISYSGNVAIFDYRLALPVETADNIQAQIEGELMSFFRQNLDKVWKMEVIPSKR